jgi:hypothetical protein
VADAAGIAAVWRAGLFAAYPGIIAADIRPRRPADGSLIRWLAWGVSCPAVWVRSARWASVAVGGSAERRGVNRACGTGRLEPRGSTQFEGPRSDHAYAKTRERKKGIRYRGV